MSQGGGRAGVQALRRVCAGHIQGQQRRHSSRRKVDAGQGVDREVSVMENKILTACYLLSDG